MWIWTIVSMFLKKQLNGAGTNTAMCMKISSAVMMDESITVVESNKDTLNCWQLHGQIYVVSLITVEKHVAIASYQSLQEFLWSDPGLLLEISHGQLDAIIFMWYKLWTMVIITKVIFWSEHLFHSRGRYVFF